uniref:Uncharacterized protein n=1 Tax=Gracilinema caldarium TaxID=215591 RepID=A0A7C3E898_9SPIR
MALYKEITTQSGLSANYHRIGSLYITKGRDVFLTVHSYRDISFKDSAPMCETEYNFSFNDFIDYYVGDKILNGSYNLLKELPIFKDAEDC